MRDDGTGAAATRAPKEKTVDLHRASALGDGISRCLATIIAAICEAAILLHGDILMIMMSFNYRSY